MNQCFLEKLVRNILQSIYVGADQSKQHTKQLFAMKIKVGTLKSLHKKGTGTYLALALI